MLFSCRIEPPLLIPQGRLVNERSQVWIPSFPPASILEKDTEPQTAPDEQLAPCMAASAINVWMGESDHVCKAVSQRWKVNLFFNH